MKKETKFSLILLILCLFIGINDVKAEEYEVINATKTSMHTYISRVNVGSSSTLVTFSNPSYKEITSSSGGYTFTADGVNPKFITKLAINVFGNFKTNKTYKVVYTFGFPSSIDLDSYTCVMGSYTNNTAYPPYSKTSCTVRRTDSGTVMIEGLITIEQGQYVSAIITPKFGIDTTHVYDISKENIPRSINSNFTLSYGDVYIYEQVSVADKVNETNDKLDEIQNADISDADKQLPNNDKFKDYENAEDTLKDKVNQADMSKLNLGIDETSSNFVWHSITRFIQSHTVVFGMFISILTIGIIKLALGR